MRTTIRAGEVKVGDAVEHQNLAGTFTIDIVAVVHRVHGVKLTGRFRGRPGLTGRLLHWGQKYDDEITRLDP